jgi:hypothetical protein
MKKLIIILSITWCLNVFSQIAPPRQLINLNLSKPIPSNQPEIRKGPVMLAGGAVFILAGLLTPPTMVGGSTTQKLPVYKQVRMLPIVSGALVFTIGLGITVGGN